MPPRRIGPRLRSLREERGLDVGQLAYKTGLHPSTIHKIEAGDRPNASGTVLARLADVLETTTDYLLGRTNDPSPILNAPGVRPQIRLYASRMVSLWSQLDAMAPDRLDEAVNIMVSQLELLLAVIDAQRKRVAESQEKETHPHQSEP
jgi:transcriptional regulator with XRE-family HTH domain